MVLGRNTALWLGAVASLLNVLVIVFGLHLTLEGLAALNAAAAAIIGLVANSADPTTAATFSLTTKGPVAASSIATGSSSGGPTSGGSGGPAPSAATTAAPSTDPTAGTGAGGLAAEMNGGPEG